MPQLPMYQGVVNSPQTELAAPIDATQDTIPLLDASVLPPAPNLATLGSGENAETILYNGVEGNTLTGVTRGFQGVARAWAAGTKVARLFTAYDHEAFRANIIDHEARIEQNTSAAQQAQQTAQQVQQALGAHLNDDVRHVTQIEKETWNNKVSKNGDVMNGSYYITSNYPIVLGNPAGGKLWTLHRTAANRPFVDALIFAPRNDDNTNWDWDKQIVFTDKSKIEIGNAGIGIIVGIGSPEGNVTAPTGCIYLQQNGPVYVKTSGSGNTGWRQVQTS